MAVLTATEITNRYLYGQSTTPADLASQDLIRPTDATSPATQDKTAFMSEGAGRFAIGALFDLVQMFFSPTSVIAPGTAIADYK